MSVDLDIVMPVYHEGDNIVGVLEALRKNVKHKFRVLICYDMDEDNTLAALKNYDHTGFDIGYVKNRGKGALGAVFTGMEDSSAPCVLVMPADDDYNAPRLDEMVDKMLAGADIVTPSRFIGDGCMVNCPAIKNFLVRTTAFAMYHIARLPTHDATNGFRMFSQRVIRTIPIESRVGFAYSLELLAKAHRLGWKIEEVPVQWFERKAGASRFRVFKWAGQYLKWVRYALATTFLFRGPKTVKLKPGATVEPAPVA
jgi:glycosyltransferase involved in cell wall biosynthesis